MNSGGPWGKFSHSGFFNPTVEAAVYGLLWSPVSGFITPVALESSSHTWSHMAHSLKPISVFIDLCFHPRVTENDQVPGELVCFAIQDQ